jgi:hypothetical protein
MEIDTQAKATNPKVVAKQKMQLPGQTASYQKLN